MATRAMGSRIEESTPAQILAPGWDRLRDHPGQATGLPLKSLLVARRGSRVKGGRRPSAQPTRSALEAGGARDHNAGGPTQGHVAEGRTSPSASRARARRRPTPSHLQRKPLAAAATLTRTRVRRHQPKPRHTACPASRR